MLKRIYETNNMRKLRGFSLLVQDVSVTDDSAQ